MRILHLEDSVMDAKLVAATLKEAGINGEITRVESQEAFVEALDTLAPDLILADYRLPSFDGRQALLLAQKRCPATPFIFVTGAMGEEIAIDTVKQGATDYVLKQRLSRLGHAVKRALQESRERAERLRAEQQVAELNKSLKQRLDELQALFDLAPVGIALSRDPSCMNIVVNPVGSAMLGVLPGENASKSAFPQLPFKVMKDGREVPPDELPMQAAARTGKAIRDEEYQIVRADGSVLHLLEYATPLRDEHGQVRGALGVWVDVSAYKRSEAALVASREEAQRLSRIKDNFLATLSHELRTPLTPILGWARMIRSSRMSEADVLRGIDIIERNVQSQITLVEDLLDISRITAGKMRIEPAVIKFGTVVQAALEAVRPSADNKKVSITFDQQQNEPIFADASRLQQVVWNLLNNAVKFTPSGGRIEIRLAQRGEEVELEIADNGQGIETSYLPSLFNMFSQADGTTSRRHGGLGIGLSVVKHLVEMHGGSVRAESKGLNCGATFTVSLPVSRNQQPATSARPEAKNASTRPLTGVSVLIVDDHEDARDVIRCVVETAGGNVALAASVAEALTRFAERQPDIILADISMPEADGFALLRAVRAINDTVPVVALTALARAEDRKKMLEEGFQYHIAKPVDPAALVNVITSLTDFVR